MLAETYAKGLIAKRPASPFGAFCGLFGFSKAGRRKVAGGKFDLSVADPQKELPIIFVVGLHAIW